MSDKKNENAPYAVEGNDVSGFEGVDPDRMTYANEVDRPRGPKTTGETKGKDKPKSDESDQLKLPETDGPKAPSAPKK